MAKKDRFPEGYSDEFVPHYQHAYGPPRESEGSGSSGRVDTEITASEDSFAPVRKCISLNSDMQDSFGVPTQVLPLLNISSSARKDLVLRLRAELERIRILQKKVDLQRSNGGVMSSSNGPPQENAQKSSMLTSEQRKNSNHPVHKCCGWNRGSSGKIESAKEALRPSTSTTMVMKHCETLLKRLMAHEFAWVFNSPVDVVKLNIPDYFNVIKHPMDFGTIKSKISSGLYSTPLEFVADVRLTFSNAKTYNPPGNDVHIMAVTLGKFFEMRWKAIEKKISTNDDKILPPKSGFCGAMETDKSMPPSKKRKITYLPQEVMSHDAERIMTDQEKHSLGIELEALLEELPMNIVDFLREHSPNGREIGEDEIEIDIDDLNDDTLFTLRKLLDDYLREKQKNCAKVEPCEIELLNESGPSSSSVQQCKVNPVDEDVDIGGSELPVSSYPPVEMAKDSDHRSSKCISSGSYGGNADLNSSSSSGSEMDGAKASYPENFGSGLDIINKNASVSSPVDGNQPVSGLDKLDLIIQKKPKSSQSNPQQEGEIAPTERQVSPEKLYRAALLKNRFADTILKAREKTLNEGVKGDLEKLRREREELEMQRKKEKARLQAEAKVAEDARRRAEAEAVAEARRKRELERVAAREALQKMEKTVEINENCQLLKDLEKLRAVPSEHLLSSVDETSLDLSQEGLGSFKFGGSNPLEQLGLFMKMDEDEEEGDPPCALDMVDDVEEGEID
ncbi:transcription factor GTE8-like isoform X2 [Malania oleifera]|uniref:transcription factor GTE8-like isoform X2 n=1 Tax=Malania oleifera TaxID=397392 RepID=UPI0025ADC4EB|nr:transcription factor GTE8-like isoform X2 [Malania oleifera]